jgi:hypothetical protein
MSVLFEVESYDGKRVRLTHVQWLHIVFFHPEVESELDKLERTLKKPEIVVEGATSDTKVCYRVFRVTPVSRKYLAVVVKVLDGEGFIMTSYYTERIRRGRVLWKKSASS